MRQISRPEEERAVIHIALDDPERFSNHLDPGDFFDEQNRAIWQAGRDLITAGTPVSLGTLADVLKPDVAFRLSEINDRSYDSPVYFETYVENLRKTALRRAYLSVCDLALRVPVYEEEPTDVYRAPPDSDRELDALIAQLGVLRAKKQTVRSGPPTTWTARELLAAEFPEPRWAVPGIIPVGLSMLAGRPKVGKSWLALQIAIAKGCGGYALGQHIEPGKVFYIALEDSGRRLQERTTKQAMPAAADITFATTWRRFTDGGLDDLRRAITDNGYSLVIVDTLGRALGRVRHDDYGDMTAAVGELQELALLQDIAILAIDHHRKSSTEQQYLDPIDEIQGSTAKSGSVDAAIGLFKEQGKRGAVLKVTGRDVAEQELALSWDALTCCWQLEGTAAEVALRGHKGDVLDLLRESGDTLTLTELAGMTKIDKGNLQPILNDLVTDGHIERCEKRGREVPYKLRESF